MECHKRAAHRVRLTAARLALVVVAAVATATNTPACSSGASEEDRSNHPPSATERASDAAPPYSGLARPAHGRDASWRGEGGARWRLGTVEVQIRGRDGHPVPYARTRVRNHATGAETLITAGADGIARLDGVSEGAYSFDASAAAGPQNLGRITELAPVARGEVVRESVEVRASGVPEGAGPTRFFAIQKDGRFLPLPTTLGGGSTTRIPADWRLPGRGSETPYPTHLASLCIHERTGTAHIGHLSLLRQQTPQGSPPANEDNTVSPAGEDVIAAGAAGIAETERGAGEDRNAPGPRRPAPASVSIPTRPVDTALGRLMWGAEAPFPDARVDLTGRVPWSSRRVVLVSTWAGQDGVFHFLLPADLPFEALEIELSVPSVEATIGRWYASVLPEELIADSGTWEIDPEYRAEQRRDRTTGVAIAQSVVELLIPLGDAARFERAIDTFRRVAAQVDPQRLDDLRPEGFERSITALRAQFAAHLVRSQDLTDPTPGP